MFQFYEDVPTLIQEASSVLTKEGSHRLLNPVWECPYRVVKVTRSQMALMWVIRSRWAQV